ncbi:MAG: DUF3489 domain-containing protein [Pseudomonadota bacterium]
MTDLTDTQRAVLAAACARPDRSLLPLPERLKGGAAKKTLAPLVDRGLAAETGPDSAPVATDAAFEALGLREPEAADEASESPQEAGPATGPKTRAGTKQATLIELLRREGGVTLNEMTEATGWAPHTVRGALSGALRKRLGLDVRSDKVEGRGRVYAIAD